MVAIWNRENHYTFILSFVLLLSFFSSPNLSRRRVDVCHTRTHGVALVLAENTGRKKSQKIAIWAGSE